MSRTLRAFTLLFAWLAVNAPSAEPRVMFLRAPALVPEQEIVTYVLRIPRHAENRRLLVVAEDAGLEVSTMERELAGVNSPILWNLRWRLPAGELSLVATLFTQDQQVGRAVHLLTVYERGP